MSEGDHVTMIHGGQGGWHIDVSGFYALADWTIATQSGYFVGVKALLDDVVDWPTMNRFCDYENETLKVCVHVEDLEDRSIKADDCVMVVADLHADDVPICAAR